MEFEDGQNVSGNVFKDILKIIGLLVFTGLLILIFILIR